MGTAARATFEANTQDVVRLMELHEEFGGTDPGRRVGLEVLNKSGIVLMCAVWEAYVEDLAAEAIEHFVENGTAAKLPVALREAVGKELKTDRDAASPWKLAGRGWKRELRSRLKGLQAQRNLSLNTPKAPQVDRFFETALGIPEVSDSWRWPGMNATRARAKLDEYVSLRGDIAHRGETASGVRKKRVKSSVSTWSVWSWPLTTSSMTASTTPSGNPCSDAGRGRSRGSLHEACLPEPGYGAACSSGRAQALESRSEGATARVPVPDVRGLAFDGEEGVGQDAALGPRPELGAPAGGRARIRTCWSSQVGLALTVGEGRAATCGAGECEPPGVQFSVRAAMSLSAVRIGTETNAPTHSSPRNSANDPSEAPPASSRRTSARAATTLP